MITLDLKACAYEALAADAVGRMPYQVGETSCRYRYPESGTRCVIGLGLPAEVGPWALEEVSGEVPELKTFTKVRFTGGTLGQATRLQSLHDEVVQSEPRSRAFTRKRFLQACQDILND